MIHHTYNNGLTFNVPETFYGAISRAKKYVNLHEPFEESVFDHILKNTKINHFIDVGSAWGYYSILVKKISPNTNVIGIEPRPELIEIAKTNQQLNEVGEISFVHGSVSRQPHTVKLVNLIKNYKQVELIKIDIDGGARKALMTAHDAIFKFKNIVIGTHGLEHKNCLKFLCQKGFIIKMDYTSEEIPLQPDGLIWATHEDS